MKNKTENIIILDLLNKRNDHELRKLLIVKQILIISTLKNVLRTI